MRKPNNELGVKCNTCKKLTDLCEPVSIKKLTGNRYHISGICKECGHKKAKFLNEAQINILPPEILTAQENTVFDKPIERSGGVFPVLGLIGAIAGAITALSTAGGVVADKVIQAKNLEENKRHHQQLEAIAGSVTSSLNKSDDLPDEINNDPKDEEDRKIFKYIKYLQQRGFGISIIPNN